MLDATTRNFPWCTTLVMAAAVADFRPANPAPGKIKKDVRGLQVAMEPIGDEMPRLAAKKGSRLLIGFAAETDQLEANARGKLKRKGLDLIVANDVTQEGAGFGVDTNIVTLIDAADGEARRHPQMSKDAVADLILDRVVAFRQALAPRGTKAKSSPKSVRLRSVR
jgi:phosphopantothenoylcysteine decarboxylase/phosphopantothenate--cysteine ligase